MPAPHVVLLGAGASRAAFPLGDRNGHFLPLMTDFGRLEEVSKLLLSAGINPDGNFEEVYSDLAGDPDHEDLCRRLEASVYRYFSQLALPDTPTIYDHLIVALRPKDVIATFNWDPFLIQAARRHSYLGNSPRLLFLHGNVLHGYCAGDRISGVRGAKCSVCGKPLKPDPLLFPIAQKDYEADPAIFAAWESLRDVLKHAFMLSIFGYGAPKSDLAAVDIMKAAWGDVSDRWIEQTEIIDIRTEPELRDLWDPFIHTHHYDILRSFYDCWLAKHPRRTGEAFRSQHMEALFIEEHLLPSEASLQELRAWLKPLIDVERQVARSSSAPVDDRIGSGSNSDRRIS